MLSIRVGGNSIYDSDGGAIKRSFQVWANHRSKSSGAQRRSRTSSKKTSDEFNNQITSAALFNETLDTVRHGLAVTHGDNAAGHGGDAGATSDTFTVSTAR
jgi:hypothetical protein